jgi:acetyl esterase/lipase
MLKNLRISSALIAILVVAQPGCGGSKKVAVSQPGESTVPDVGVADVGDPGDAPSSKEGANISSGDAGLDSAVSFETAPDCSVQSVREQRNLVYKEIPGVDPNLLSVDVYEPVRADGCPAAPLVVWVHGGAWVVGDKANKMADKVALFTQQGWALASVNYRLSKRPAEGREQTVQYPAHNQDVAAAIAWLVENSAQWNANPEELLLFGHSAGAGIVSQISTNERFLEAEGLNLSALRCAAMLDTEAYDVRAMCEEGIEVYLNAFGSDPEVWDEASAINHVEAGKGIPASLIVTRVLMSSLCDGFPISLSDGHRWG